MQNFQKYFSFNLTDEQQKTLYQLIDFIDSDKSVFILKGYAGTGKTSLMQGLVKYFGDNKRPFLLMASTGRAAKVMAQKARFPAGTLHGSIYALQVVELKNKSQSEDASFKISFKLKAPNYNNNLVCFVDESSMLTNSRVSDGALAFGSGRLLTDFFNYIGKGKVVFIGDPAQLPPVNSKFSAALNMSYLEKEFNIKVDEAQLTKVMRFDNNSGIAYNTTLLRQTIMSQNLPPLSIKTSGFNDIKVYNTENDLINEYYNCIKTKGVDSAVYISLSNKVAGLINNKIRHKLWGKKSSIPLMPGESLMAVRNNYLYNISNGDLLTVDSINSKIEKKAGLNFRKITIRVTDPDPTKGSILKEVLIIEDILFGNTRDLSLEQDLELLKNYFARMKNFAANIYDSMTNTENTDEAKQLVVNYVASNNIILDIDEIFENGISRKHLIKIVSYNNMQSDPYLNALRVKYGYAITCHKAQGSEWQDLFIHLEKSMFYLPKENQYRWTYTALSRAEKKVHILNNSCLY